MADGNSRGGQDIGYQVVRKNGPVPVPVSSLCESRGKANDQKAELDASQGVTHTVVQRRVPASTFSDSEALSRYDPETDACPGVEMEIERDHERGKF